MTALLVLMGAWTILASLWGLVLLGIPFIL